MPEMPKQLSFADAEYQAKKKQTRRPEEIALAFRAGAPLSCLFVDVDHFKNFNDLYGHQAGDRVLRGVAQ